MSGALDDLQYQTLFRRYQKSMVALLAIEQLTGALRAPTVTINAENHTEIAKLISVMREELSKIDEQMSSLKEENNRLNDERNKPTTSAKQKEEIDKMVASNNLKIKNYKSDRESFATAIERAHSLIARGIASRPARDAEMPSSMSKIDIKSVSDTVKDIVLEIVKIDDMGQLCFAFLKEKANGEKTDKEKEKEENLTAICNNYFGNDRTSKELTDDIANLHLAALNDLITHYKSSDAEPQAQTRCLSYISDKLSEMLRHIPKGNWRADTDITLQNVQKRKYDMSQGDFFLGAGGYSYHPCNLPPSKPSK